MKHDRTEDIDLIIEYLGLIGDMVAKIDRTLFWHSVLLLLIISQVIYFSFKY